MGTHTHKEREKREREREREREVKSLDVVVNGSLWLVFCQHCFTI